ncbi:hypothetical protein F5888DRAFT_902467 [Russula emetica]|nr:hypothetical protein F5888DRAFT_902467 [Russula emetica]
MAIAHDDDLRLIEGMETLTADSIEEFLREKQMPLVVENGVAILRHPAEKEPPASEEKKAISHAASELNGESVPLVIHPALTKYNLKLDSFDHDYDLPKEINDPAVYPPMLSQLEGHQDHPQIITVEASVDSRGIGVTVQDVLRTIHEDMRISELGAEECAGINTAFGETCKSEEELSKGPRSRIDHLGGRDKIQILLKFAPDGSELTPTSTLHTHALHSGRIFK